MNIIIQLRDQLIKSPLLGFHAALLSGLNSGDYGGELTDLYDTLIEVIFVLLFDLELKLSECIVYLAVQIDHVTHILELLINIVEVAGLFDELVHIFDLLGQVRDALPQPLLLDVGPLADDLRHQSLYLTYKVLRGRQQGRPAPLRIDLEKTDVGH
jgi:hypothetical protein